MRPYRGEYLRDKLFGAPSEAVSENRNAFYDGDLDDGNWAMADLESTPEGSEAGRAWKIRERFRRIREVSQEAGAEVPQNLLKLLSSLAKQPVLVPSPAIISSSKRSEEQRDACCEKVCRS